MEASYKGWIHGGLDLALAPFLYQQSPFSLLPPSLFPHLSPSLCSSLITPPLSPSPSFSQCLLPFLKWRNPSVTFPTSTIFCLSMGVWPRPELLTPRLELVGPCVDINLPSFALYLWDIFYHSNQKTNAETEAVANVTPMTFPDSRGNNKANDWQAPGRTSGWPWNECLK